MRACDSQVTELEPTSSQGPEEVSVFLNAVDVSVHTDLTSGMASSMQSFTQESFVVNRKEYVLYIADKY